MIGRKVKCDNRKLVECIGIVLDKVTATVMRDTQVVDNGKIFTIKIPLAIDHYVIRGVSDNKVDIVETMDVLEVL
jgi:hypothetical protein